VQTTAKPSGTNPVHHPTGKKGPVSPDTDMRVMLPAPSESAAAQGNVDHADEPAMTTLARKINEQAKQFAASPSGGEFMASLQNDNRIFRTTELPTLTRYRNIRGQTLPGIAIARHPANADEAVKRFGEFLLDTAQQSTMLSVKYPGLQEAKALQWGLAMKAFRYRLLTALALGNGTPADLLDLGGQARALLAALDAAFPAQCRQAEESLRRICGDAWRDDGRPVSAELLDAKMNGVVDSLRDYFPEPVSSRINDAALFPVIYLLATYVESAANATGRPLP
jgi:hypothetical protein